MGDVSLNRAERRRLAQQKLHSQGDPEIVHDPDMQYITMWQMANWLGVQPGTLSRWVGAWRLELGALPIVKGRKGRQFNQTGYSIPATYCLVAKGWTLTKDPDTREAMLAALPTNPKPWVVVVGTVGYTCDTAEEASQEVTRILTAEGMPESVQVFHVGEVPTLN